MVSMEGKQTRRKRRRFNAEFKARAVNLVLKQGMSVADAARDLDVVPSGLHQWVRQARIDQGKGPAGALTTEEKLELAQLRKENRILREERDILKKAAAF